MSHRAPIAYFGAPAGGLYQTTPDSGELEALDASGAADGWAVVWNPHRWGPGKGGYELRDGGTPLTPRGAWDAGTAYAPGDVVTSAGNSYVARVAVAAGGAAPVDGATWQILAAAGADGTTFDPSAYQLRSERGQPGGYGSLGSDGHQPLAELAPHTHAASEIRDSSTVGRALLTAIDVAAQRTALGLGTAATRNVPAVAGAAASAAEVVRGDDPRLGAAASGTAGAQLVPLHAAGLTTTIPLTNMPAAVQQVGNSAGNLLIPLAGRTHAQVIGAVATAASSGELRVQYSVDGQTNWRYLDGAGGPALRLGNTGVRAGVGATLEAAARAWVYVRLVSVNGSGSATPVLGSVHLVHAAALADLAAATDAPPSAGVGSGYSLSFNGNGFLTMPASAFLPSPLTAFTLRVSVKRTANNTNQSLIALDSGGNVELYLSGGNLLRMFGFTLAFQQGFTGTVPVGTWSELWATWRNSDGAWAYYLNGAPAGSGTGATVSGGKTVTSGRTIGGLSNSAERYTGLMSETEAWNRYMDAPEIASLSGHRLLGTESGLVHNLRLDDGAGAVALDRSPTAANGAFTIASGQSSSGLTWVQDSPAFVA